MRFCRSGKHAYDPDTFRQCPDCKVASDSSFRARNLEQIKACSRSRYLLNRDGIIKKALLWAKDHPERRRETRRAWVERHPEKMDACREAWAASNLHKIRATRRNYMARRKSRMKANGLGERIDPIVVWSRDNAVCHICKDTVSFHCMHLDHVVPLSRGGTHTYDNVKASHADCNHWKSARMMEDLNAC